MKSVENDEEDMTAAASAVLQHRLSGKPLPLAIDLVAASHSLRPDDVSEFWLRKKEAALTELTVGRIVDAVPWTEEDIARLCEIFLEQRL